MDVKIWCGPTLWNKTFIFLRWLKVTKAFYFPSKFFSSTHPIVLNVPMFDIMSCKCESDSELILEIRKLWPELNKLKSMWQARWRALKDNVIKIWPCIYLAVNSCRKSDILSQTWHKLRPRWLKLKPSEIKQIISRTGIFEKHTVGQVKPSW